MYSSLANSVYLFVLIWYLSGYFIVCSWHIKLYVKTLNGPHPIAFIMECKRTFLDIPSKSIVIIKITFLMSILHTPKSTGMEFVCLFVCFHNVYFVNGISSTITVFVRERAVVTSDVLAFGCRGWKKVSRWNLMNGFGEHIHCGMASLSFNGKT